MDILEDTIKDIITDYRYCVIAGCILLAAILLIIFILKVCSIAKSQKAKNIILERIAKVIEQESEPYVIERPEKTVKSEKKVEKPAPVKPQAEAQPPKTEK